MVTLWAIQRQIVPYVDPGESAVVEQKERSAHRCEKASRNLPKMPPWAVFI